jgi:hypothetical protein
MSAFGGKADMTYCGAYVGVEAVAIVVGPPRSLRFKVVLPKTNFEVHAVKPFIS